MDAHSRPSKFICQRDSWICEYMIGKKSGTREIVKKISIPQSIKGSDMRFSVKLQELIPTVGDKGKISGGPDIAESILPLPLTYKSTLYIF